MNDIVVFDVVSGIMFCLLDAPDKMIQTNFLILKIEFHGDYWISSNTRKERF